MEDSPVHDPQIYSRALTMKSSNPIFLNYKGQRFHSIRKQSFEAIKAARNLNVVTGDLSPDNKPVECFWDEGKIILRRIEIRPGKFAHQMDYLMWYESFLKQLGIAESRFWKNVVYGSHARASPLYTKP